MPNMTDFIIQGKKNKETLNLSHEIFMSATDY